MKLRKDIIAILVFAVLIVAGVALIDGISKKGARSELELVRDAVREAVLTCYAIEGEYPRDLEYLRNNYGLSYNEEHYIVIYERDGMANVFPSFTVLKIGGDAV